jgi:hypothetical protein
MKTEKVFDWVRTDLKSYVFYYFNVVLLIMQFSPASYHLIPPGSKYFPQHPVLKYTQSMSEWSARRKAATYTGQHKHRINANIHACSGIRIHDPSVQVGENISCLRPRGHCDRHCRVLGFMNKLIHVDYEN